MYLFEVSYECGNKVGGIWNVIRSKSKLMKKKFGDNYYTIGFYNPNRVEVIEKEPPKFLKDIFEKLKEKKIYCKFGKWVEANSVNIIQIDSREFQKEKVNWIKGKFWELYKIDSLYSGNDYNEPLAWSYAVGLLLEEIKKKINDKIVAHFHEWLSGGALLYLKSINSPIPLVFTTHATFLGRVMASHRKDFYQIIDKIDPVKEAYNYGIQAKYLTEKATAQNADVFTTVSDITGMECEYLLGRKPDIITPNALNSEELPPMTKLIKDKIALRERIDNFVKLYFYPYYYLDLNDYLIIFTSGRYEFWNKGYDLFIEVISRLNNKLKGKNKWILVFMLVPTGTLGLKDEVAENIVTMKRIRELIEEDMKKLRDQILDSITSHKELNKDLFDKILLDIKKLENKIKNRSGRNAPICSHQLSYNENNDLIIKKLREKGLTNKKEDPVKIVFYPVYLNREDELLGLNYFDFVNVASVGVFLSRYEPWGYTPLESACYLSSAVTTDLAGFGSYVEKNLKDKKGIFVAKLKEGEENAINSIVDFLENLVNLDKGKRLELEIETARLARKYFNWKIHIKKYFKAYNLAIKRMRKRLLERGEQNNVN